MGWTIVWLEKCRRCAQLCSLDNDELSTLIAGGPVIGDMKAAIAKTARRDNSASQDVFGKFFFPDKAESARRTMGVGGVLERES